MAKIYIIWRYEKLIPREFRYYEMVNIFSEKKDAWLYVQGRSERDKEYKYYYMQEEVKPY